MVREACEDITERVIEYRARLLALVARRLPGIKELQPVASLTSLDLGLSPWRCKSPSKPTSGKTEN